MLQEVVACGLPEVHLQAGYNLTQLFVPVLAQQPAIVDIVAPAHDLHPEHILLQQEAVVVAPVAHVQAIALLLPEVRVLTLHLQEVVAVAVPVLVAEVAAVAAVVQVAAVAAVVQVDADKFKVKR